MALQNHVSELQRKHDALEREIQQCKTQPSTDDGKIAELKRKKLLLKDELSRLKTADAKVH